MKIVSETIVDRVMPKEIRIPLAYRNMKLFEGKTVIQRNEDGYHAAWHFNLKEMMETKSQGLKKSPAPLSSRKVGVEQKSDLEKTPVENKNPNSNSNRETKQRLKLLYKGLIAKKPVSKEETTQTQKQDNQKPEKK